MKSEQLIYTPVGHRPGVWVSGAAAEGREQRAARSWELGHPEGRQDVGEPSTFLISGC